jgi:hypothetical protein
MSSRVAREAPGDWRELAVPLASAGSRIAMTAGAAKVKAGMWRSR